METRIVNQHSEPDNINNQGIRNHDPREVSFYTYLLSKMSEI